MAQSATSSRLQVSLVALAATAALGATVIATVPAAPAGAGMAVAAADNTLSAQEQAAGWRLLFDGTTTKGWRNAHADTFPSKGWLVKDGLLSVVESGGAEAAHGGDIVTLDEYGDFELKVDVKLTKGANSGIKYSSPRSWARPAVARPSASSSSCWTIWCIPMRRQGRAATGRSGRCTT